LIGLSHKKKGNVGKTRLMSLKQRARTKIGPLEETIGYE
jgi:hypothetical protein